MEQKKCKTCDWVLSRHEEEYPSLNKKNEKDIEMAEEYCTEHALTYSHECTPLWCDECGHLTIYQIIVTDASRLKTPNFDKRK